ncbi:MAG: hypothetical protein QM528_02150 [Phycisphaerales bacterium]|nr:hypothetical protein [Phycisphaerales bacterium]
MHGKLGKCRQEILTIFLTYPQLVCPIDKILYLKFKKNTYEKKSMFLGHSLKRTEIKNVNGGKKEILGCTPDGYLCGLDTDCCSGFCSALNGHCWDR